MDEHNIYEIKSDEDRRTAEQSDKEVTEQTKDYTELEKARVDRARRRDGRKALCRCGRRTRTRSRSKRGARRRIISQNPFIIFFLEMYFKTPEKRVTEVARQAGKEWCALPQEERIKYIRLAEKERMRRRGGRPIRRRGCAQRQETSDGR